MNPLDPAEVRPGVLHLGIGGFARAHQAVVLERMMVATGDLSWGMVGVSQRSPAAAEALRRQSCRYSLMYDRSGPATVVGSVHDAYFAGDDPHRVTRDVAAGSTRLVTVTVTEKGYRPPSVAAGQLAEGLRERSRTGAPLTVLSCDNLPGNGVLLAGLVDEALGDEAARTWVRENVRFPDTVVDRMVPRTTEDVCAAASGSLGWRDECALVTEPFLEWVIADPGPGVLPDLTLGGAVLSREVAVYAERKLRILNAAHSALCWWGVLAGHRYVADVMADETIVGAVRSMLVDDVLPILRAPEGTRLTDYLDSVFERCANPALRHATAQVCGDGSLKVGPRLLDSAVANLRLGRMPHGLAAAVGAWLRCTTTSVDDTGRPLDLDDPMAARIRATRTTADALRTVHPEAADHADFVHAVAQARHSSP
ncbi:mannitol dehydrogenase family protein [Pseudonocardia spinosispora]|uniref:mannitol dehydrogenase family protein n=1 Tax=Pseudonocardia spinosispora TaxID=103441 RepID=UPI0003FC9C15|nr:mannitol dehydrogenase family protein [Pseudonocardia spinosispora]